jgi:low temperature requirement protein LtrA
VGGGAALDYTGALHGFSMAGLGRSRTEEWTIEGRHLAERYQPFVIVALGESILLTGATFADLDPSAGTVTAFVVAFAAA